jgi:hypothetical protein
VGGFVHVVEAGQGSGKALPTSWRSSRVGTDAAAEHGLADGEHGRTSGMEK